VKLLPRIWADDEEEDPGIDAEAASTRIEARGSAVPWMWSAGIATAAAVPRLAYLFFISDPENPGDGWIGDAYHHWQIAYLTKEIGFTAPGGPRLWDLKGLDYFWGILHPLLLAGLMTATGSNDIVLARLLSIAFGVLIAVLIFHICRRHWGINVALAGCLFAVISPTSVFNDSAGLLEQLGVGLMLLGIWAWPKGGLWTGVSWALAALARAEAWIFSIGMVVAAFLRREGAVKRIPMVIGWAVVIGLYMKVLLDHTGNPIYPLSENFFNNAVGRWEFATSLTPDQLAARPVLGLTLGLSVVGLGLTLWKRPAGYMFLTFGFGHWVFTAGTLGFTAYLKSWVSWFPVTRFFVFPYEFAAVLVAIFLFRWLPGRFGKVMLPAGWVVTAAALLAVQSVWIEIQDTYNATRVTWAESMASAKTIGDIYDQPQHQGRVLNLPPTKPALVYAMAHFDGIEGRYLVSQLYDPFYYLPSTYTYQDHRDVAGVLLQCWLSDTKSDLFVVDTVTSQNYVGFIADHAGWFTQVGSLDGYSWKIYVAAVPKPSPSECRAAGDAARR
jgi:hypothetical protein